MAILARVAPEVLEDVGQRLVNRQKKMVARLRRKRLRRQPGRDLQFALDAGPPEVFLGILPDIGDQMLQRILLRD